MTDYNDDDIDDNNNSETLWLAHQQAREGNYRMALLNYESIIEDMEVSQETPSRPYYVPFQEHAGGGRGGDRGSGSSITKVLIQLAWHNKAVCLSRLGRTDEALVAAVQALKLDIHNHKMIMNVAILLAEGQQFSEVK